MMTNYTDLQKAAAYAAQDTIKFADEDEEMRALQQFHEEVDPETVLALIAENNRLNAENKQLILLECHGGTAQAAINLLSERDQLKAENEALRSDIQSWRLSIEAERNVHKLSMKGIQDELDRLKGLGFAEELAVLRKSAARYQWLREARSGYIEVVEWIGPHATGMTGEDLDSLLDAAMGMGGRS